MQRMILPKMNVDSTVANPVEPRLILSHLFHLHIFFLFFRKTLDLKSFSLISSGNVILMNIIIITSTYILL